MTSLIQEFESKKKPSGYYEKLVSELTELNKEYHAFNNFNENLRMEKDAHLPFSTKANICVKGFETTAGSKMLKGYIPPFNATVVERMYKTGRFSFLGETNMDEFGFGTFGLNTEVPARNAFNSDYVAGGSSSGAAVATAMLKYHVAISESTGGSISAPAAINGVVGFTPTYGAVSRYGLIDYANSLDKIGVMARSSDDVRIVFDAIRGRDEKDTTSATHEIKNVKKEKLYVVKELLQNTDEQVRSSFEKLLSKLEKDYKVNYISLDVLSKAVAPYYIIAMAEASTNLARYTGFKFGLHSTDMNKRYNEFFTDARTHFGIEAKRRIILGTFIRSASVKDKYYSKALSIRRLIINEMSKVLKDGFLISPALPIQTPKVVDAKKLTPIQNYTLDMLTIPPNLGGFPHITFPYEYIDGMPLGAQLITEQANDHALLDFVSHWEKQFTYKFKHNVGSL